MKNITIIKELLFIINFREVNNEEDIKKLAYSARLVTMFILFSLICLIGILIAKEKFYYPINVTIVILVACFFVVIPTGILFINKNKIAFLIQKYEFEKRQKQEQEEAPILRITLKDGEAITGKFFIEKGNWLKSIDTNISYNENYIVKIERL